MSNSVSRSASAECTEGPKLREASTSRSRSPDSTALNGVDDNRKDDTRQDDKNDDKDRSASADAAADKDPTPSQGDWQAIFAPVHNAYYFYNSRTNETTWTNPLQPKPATNETGEVVAGSSYPSTTTTDAAQAAAEAAGIDPSLAYLDPSLGLPGSTPAGTFTAKFNARTGAFARVDARDPSHLSESERAKRMSQVYFDVGAWEKELEQRKVEEEAEGSGKKRKRPTKKDLVSSRPQHASVAS